MAPMQQLRAVLHALGSAGGLSGDAGSFMRVPDAEPGAAPPAAVRAAFKAQHAAVLVDPSGQLNLAASLSAAELQQVGRNGEPATAIALAALASARAP